MELHRFMLFLLIALKKKKFSLDAPGKCCSDGGRGRMSRQPFAAYAGVRDVRNAINRSPLATTSIECVSWSHIDSSISCRTGTHRSTVETAPRAISRASVRRWDPEDRLNCSSIVSSAKIKRASGDPNENVFPRNWVL